MSALDPFKSNFQSFLLHLQAATWRPEWRSGRCRAGHRFMCYLTACICGYVPLHDEGKTQLYKHLTYWHAWVIIRKFVTVADWELVLLIFLKVFPTAFHCSLCYSPILHVLVSQGSVLYDCQNQQRPYFLCLGTPPLPHRSLQDISTCSYKAWNEEQL